MYCDLMWWWWLWWWRLESSMLLLPSLRGGEWNTEPEWHLERSARTMLDISVKIQQRWLNMAVQNWWWYYEDMTKDFMRGTHVQMSLRKPQTYLMAAKTTSLAGFWFSKFAKIVIKKCRWHWMIRMSAVTDPEEMPGSVIVRVAGLPIVCWRWYCQTR